MSYSTMFHHLLAGGARWTLIGLAGISLCPSPLQAAAAARTVPKWERFEKVLESSASYANPVQEATLTAIFTSPSGDNYQVYGFWDGKNTWRVRFSPNQAGTWKFKTSCSDAANKGLHEQSGDFLCTAPSGKTRFTQHG